MSHFTTMRTKLTDEGLLRTSLVKLGYRVLPGRSTIGGWRGQSREVDVGVPDIVDGYGVGFTLEQGAFTAVADWSELEYRGVSRRPFVEKVSQTYGLEAAMTALAPQGFTVVEQRTEENGSLRLVMRRVS